MRQTVHVARVPRTVGRGARPPMSSESITVPTAAATPAKAPRTEDRIVVARRLVKTYDSGGGAVQALRGLDLDGRKGGVVAGVGPARGGQTTLPDRLARVHGFTS